VTSKGRQGESSEPPADLWDQDLANDLIGLRILVGMTHLDAGGEAIEQLQFFGVVQRADRRKGILLKLEGKRAGEEYNLPPDTRGLKRADLGEYRLRSTGEVVTDPDYVCSWTIQKPKS
jgi:hypothetical protein